MRVRLLGTAAGGGVPQWNCACANCRAARAGLMPSRTQSSVAISADGEEWFLINASPDLRAQVESFAPLHSTAGRSSPIHGVLVTNADLDHVLGLTLMREGEALRVLAPAGAQSTIANYIGRLLFSGIEWLENLSAPLTVKSLPLSSRPPPYERAPMPGAQSVAYLIHDQNTSGRLLVAPDVETLTDELRAAMSEADLILFDGTFWSDNELAAIKPGARTAREMGHLPIHEGSLSALRELSSRRVYLHINNTNPILAETPERAEVLAAGIVIGEDGMEFTV